MKKQNNIMLYVLFALVIGVILGYAISSIIYGISGNKAMAGKGAILGQPTGSKQLKEQSQDADVEYTKDQVKPGIVPANDEYKIVDQNQKMLFPGTCSDSDGNNKYNQGYVEGYWGTELNPGEQPTEKYKVWDSCYNEGARSGKDKMEKYYVLERVCELPPIGGITNEGAIIPGSTSYEVIDKPNNIRPYYTIKYECKCGCQNGRCINQNLEQCTDSDCGKNYCVGGYVSFCGVEYDDDCDSFDHVEEWYCDDYGYPKKDKQKCNGDWDWSQCFKMMPIQANQGNKVTGNVIVSSICSLAYQYGVYHSIFDRGTEETCTAKGKGHCNNCK